MIDITLEHLPRQTDPAMFRAMQESWRQRADEDGPALARFADDALAHPSMGTLLRGVFAYSPYLSQLLAAYPGFSRVILEDGPAAAFSQLTGALENTPSGLSTAALMTHLRTIKRQAALTIGLADIAGAWNLESITGALTRIAEESLRQAVRHLLEIPQFSGLPGNGAGLVVLAMGKMGAGELNYSSDIDLIVFYDDAHFDAGASELGASFVRLTRALVRIMEERTGDGYVFRTDLRLRPDPASTPLAVSLSAAEIYYGSLGQNWERAAMIKARQVAGDSKAGEALFSVLHPWIWRRSLDFAAIEDIHSIKRQIDQRKLKLGGDGLLGHNVKIGRGGIREIEFYAQTQQLVFGGRDPSLRVPATCDALRALAAANRIDATSADSLIAAYQFLRKVEHRLQMVDDRQTHSLPETAEGMDAIAGFLGYPDTGAFTAELGRTLTTVQGRFAELFGKSPSLSGPGSLVFTGVEDDPETLKTLEKLGFTNPKGVAATIRGWHHGRYRATRSERARELLTKLTPELLSAVGASGEADGAFMRFDAFLAALPAGVMLFSLLVENPQFLALLGRIMGMAPALSERLARSPALLDELLSADFFASLQDAATLAGDLDRALSLARSYEETLLRLRRWIEGRKFQVGVHVLENITDGVAAGRILAGLADLAIARLLPIVEAEFALRHGIIPDGSYAIVALGRLGGRLMSISSDLDLIAIYDAPAHATSNGAKALDASAYYTRLTQRLIAAITAPMADGKLYDVDLRLRPSGEGGPIAVSLKAFEKYHAGSAWTWEHMALTRARIIAGPAPLATKIDGVIAKTLTAQREPATLATDVADMRRRIAAEHAPHNLWDFKYVPGGLIDIEFVVQFLLLRHGHEEPQLLTTQSAVAITNLATAGHLSADQAADLTRALQLAWRVQGLIRLITPEALNPESAPLSIKKALAGEVARAAHAVDPPSVDFVQAETILAAILDAAHERFHEIVEGAVPAPSSQPT